MYHPQFLFWKAPFNKIAHSNGIRLSIVASTDPWKLVKPAFDHFDIATFIDETRTLLWACPIRLFREVSNTSSTLELYFQAYPWSFKLCTKMYHRQFLFWKVSFDKIAYKMELWCLLLLPLILESLSSQSLIALILQLLLMKLEHSWKPVL